MTHTHTGNYHASIERLSYELITAAGNSVEEFTKDLLLEAKDLASQVRNWYALAYVYVRLYTYYAVHTYTHAHTYTHMHAQVS